MLRLAQLVHDIHFTGSPILFSWPSQGGIGRYSDDQKMADASHPKLAEALKSLIEQRRQPADGTNIGKIHLIAHSMGNRVLLRAINKLIRETTPKDRPFGQIILAAPDIDSNEFNNIIPSAFLHADAVTLYFCEKDKALIASRAVHFDTRVGQVGFCRSEIINVDAANANTSWLSHDYYVSNHPLLFDLRLVVTESMKASQRTTIRPIEAPNNYCAYFGFP
jgi:esterase/lipase superfamily enzyme